jgi:hypothetical protein
MAALAPALGYSWEQKRAFPLKSTIKGKQGCQAVDLGTPRS